MTQSFSKSILAIALSVLLIGSIFVTGFTMSQVAFAQVADEPAPADADSSDTTSNSSSDQSTSAETTSDTPAESGSTNSSTTSDATSEPEPNQQTSDYGNATSSEPEETSSEQSSETTQPIGNETSEDSIPVESSVTVEHSDIEINQPVEWIQTVSLSDEQQVIAVEIPADAQDVSVNTTDGQTVEASTLSDPDSADTIVTLDDVFEVLQENAETVMVAIDKPAVSYDISYETPAPYTIENEQVTDSLYQKSVTVTHDSAFHYTDVLSYSSIPEDLVARDTQFKLYWMVDDVKTDVTNDARFAVTFVDTDDNGIADQMQWTVPQLSEQQFVIEGIIPITNAEHLDSSRNIVENVYEETRAIDEILTQPIQPGHYIRATFEQHLDSFKSIEIYAQGNTPNSSVELYEADSDTLIGVWQNISENREYKLMLTNYTGNSDSFDLKVVGGPIEFDYIKDAANVQSATLNGLSVVSVQPGASITATVNEKNTANSNWRSTAWRIATTAPGTTTCVDTPNHDGNGDYSESFTITAPAVSGTYNAYFIAYTNDSCSAGASATLALSNAVIVDNTLPIFSAQRTGLNTIQLTFSENVDSLTTGGQGYSVSGGTVTANTDPAGTSNTMTLTTSGITGTSATPTVTYASATGTTVDAAGNEVSNGFNAVASDGVAPNVNTITVNKPLIKESDVGTNAFQVVITYSEAMKTTVTPTITFVPAAGVTTAPITLTTGTGSGFSSGNTVYTAIYNIVDNNAQVTGVDIQATNGQDVAANVQSSATTADLFNIDTAAPGAPTINVPAASALVNTATPTISGTAEAGSTVTVKEGAATLGTALASGGSWTLTSSALADGSHTITATATDAAGNTGPASAGRSFTVDTVAPTTTTPIISPNPANDGPTIAASANDALPSSNIAAAEFFVDVVGANGAGTLMSASDGSFNSNSEGLTATMSNTAFNGLSEGSHTIFVHAKDNTGNWGTTSSATFTVDTTDPNTSITSNPNNPSNSASASFSFTSTEGGSTFLCQLDGAGFSACTTPKLYGGLTDSSHTFQVRAKDAAGNVDSSPASFTWTIDTVAPDSTFTSNPNNPSNSASASFSFTSTQAGSTFECQLDGTGYGACTSPKSYSGLTDSSHTFQVRATDPAGNTDSTPASFTWTVDTLVPTTNASPIGGNYNIAKLVTLTANEPATIYYTTDGTTPTTSSTSGPSPITGIVIASSTTLKFFAKDTAGNQESVKTEVYVVITDTTGPNTSSLSVSPSPANSSPTITATATDSEHNVVAAEYFIDSVGADGTGTAMSASDASFNSLSEGVTVIMASGEFSSLLDGSHTVYVHARDSIGNWGSTAFTTFVKDTQKPSGIISISDVSGQITDADLPGTFKATVDYDEAMDTLVDPTISFSNVVSNTLTLPPTSSWLDSDTFEFTYTLADVNEEVPATDIKVDGAQDVAGNIQIQSSSLAAFSIDTKNPTVMGTPSRSLPDHNGWINAPFTIDWNSPDSDVLDSNCDADETYNGPDGTGLSMSGSCTDNAGNAGAGTYGPFDYDNTDPTGVSGTLDRTPDHNGWYNSPVGVTFTGIDSTSGIDSCDHPTYSGPDTSTASQSGSCTDNAGNSASDSSPSFQYDASAPAGVSGTPDRAPDHGTWYNHAVDIVFTGADGISGIDSCTITNYSGPDSAGVTMNGSCVDNAGNPSATVPSNAFDYDATAPSISGTATVPPNSNGWYNADVTIHWTVSDAASGIDPVTSPADSTISTEGTDQYATASVGDLAGNTNTANSSPTVNIDKTVPTITGSRTPEPNINGWNNEDVVVSFSCSDALSGLDISGCPSDVTKSAEGAGQSASGTVTDKAGNSASATVSNINIDKTDPSIIGTPTTSPNANGWYKNDVTIAWTTSDSLSGINPATDPADSTVNSEGAGLTDSASVSDLAGNSASATSSPGVNIDKTAPSITAARDRAPNINDWYKGDVTVTFSCGDALSGVEFCSSPATLGEGAGQSATGTVTDKAGNTASVTESGINIDKTAPSISGAPDRAANLAGWYNADVTVSFTCGDLLSGVELCSSPTTLGEGTAQSVTGSVTDKAGNTNSATVSGINIDKTKPATTNSLAGTSGGNGWYTSSVQVTLNPTDDRSGVSSTTYEIDGGSTNTYSSPFAVSGDGIHTVTFRSTDLAGNVESTKTQTIKIDTTIPGITGSRLPLPNGNGWNKVDVTVHFDCVDATSLIASCSADTVLSAETTTAGTTITGTAIDNAGLSNTASVGPTKIDKTAPSVSITGIANGDSFYFGDPIPVAGCTASDGLSGVDGTCSVGAPSPNDGSVGSHTITATATDKAGNTGSKTITYTIKAWTLKGFYQPTDKLPTINTVKSGSTVPLKWQVYKDASMTMEITNVASIKSVNYKEVSCGSAPTDAIEEIVTTGGTVLRYDITGHQFIDNWKTPSGAGRCFDVFMYTNDGSYLNARFQMK